MSRTVADGKPENRWVQLQFYGDRMKTMPSNLRKICDGQRTDLSAEQVAAYQKICREYRGESEPETTQPQMPSLIIRGWNFANALARWTLAGMPRRTQEEIDERLAICQACDFLQNDHCTKCGCACVESNRLINKLSLSTERCPDGKWS